MSSDFWRPFVDIARLILAQLTQLTQADVVGDRFHWTCYINKVLDQQRKKLRKEFLQKEAYKNIQWLLFRQMNTLNLNEKDN